MRASPLGKVLLSFSACFALAAILFNSVSWMFVTIVLVSLFVYGRLRLVTQIEELDVDVKREVLEGMIYAKEKATIKVEILNKGFVAIKGELEDLLPPELTMAGEENPLEVEIAPRTIFRFTYSVISEKRGEFIIRGIRLRLTDDLGLNQDTIDIDCKSVVNAHTERESLETARRLAQREHLRFLRPMRNPVIALKELEFDGIREYMPGDKARDILWRALPKLGELLTKIYRKEGTLRAFIMLDCSRSMRLSANGTSMIDHGIDLALQISRVLLSSLQPTGVMLFDEVSIIDEALPETGRHQFERIISVLKKAPATIDMSAGPTEEARQAMPKAPKGTPEKEEEQSKGFIEALGELARRGATPHRGIGLENRIKQQVAKNTGSKLLFIIISDLISSRGSALSTARICQKTGNVMIMIHTYADWYSGISAELDKEEAEGLYENLRGSIAIEATLERMGAHYLRVGPADTTARIVKTIRRTT